jgi:hypothetical protein
MFLSRSTSAGMCASELDGFFAKFSMACESKTNLLVGIPKNPSSFSERLEQLIRCRELAI